MQTSVRTQNEHGSKMLTHTSIPQIDQLMLQMGPCPVCYAGAHKTKQHRTEHAHASRSRSIEQRRCCQQGALKMPCRSSTPHSCSKQAGLILTSLHAMPARTKGAHSLTLHTHRQKVGTRHTKEDWVHGGKKTNELLQVWNGGGISAQKLYESHHPETLMSCSFEMLLCGSTMPWTNGKVLPSAMPT